MAATERLVASVAYHTPRQFRGGGNGGVIARLWRLAYIFWVGLIASIVSQTSNIKGDYSESFFNDWFISPRIFIWDSKSPTGIIDMSDAPLSTKFAILSLTSSWLPVMV